MESKGYLGYQEMLSQVSGSASDLAKICKNLNLTEQADSLIQVRERIKNHTFKVGIMGEFKRGKSTVINALLGQEIVPADILPCSATLNRIMWDAHPHAQINFKSGEVKEIPVEELTDYVTKLTSESEQQSSLVEDAVVYYPCRFCQDGVQIVDTPGLNDSERMDAVAEAVIPTLDAIIMVLVPGAPFSISEANFVRNKIMTSDLGRLIFVVNKFDTVHKRDRERVMDTIRKKIEDTVLGKTENIYGKDSDEYRDTAQKLAGIRIYPVSALDALEGKMEGDEELLRSSGMPEFEAALTKLLTEERGMLELVAPVNTILSKGKDVMNAIAMRRSALEMNAQEFEAAEQEAIDALEQSRREAKAKEAETFGKGRATYERLLPQAAEGYRDIEQEMNRFVDTYPIKAEQLSTAEKFKAFEEKLNQEISQSLESCMQEITEKIQVQIQQELDKEVESISKFDRKFTADIDGIVSKLIIEQSKGSGTKKLDALDAAAVVLEVATNFTSIVPGVGSALTGFKNHGVLGGIVGLGTGYVTTMGTAWAGGMILGAAGIVVTSAAAIPVLVIAGVVGAIGGRAITDAVFGLFGQKRSEQKQAGFHPLKEADIPRLRDNLKKNVKENIMKLQEERMLENWLKNTTNEVFAGLSQELRRETEEALQTIQSTLTGIKVELAESRANYEAAMKGLNDDTEMLAEISNAIMPIKEKIDTSLAG